MIRLSIIVPVYNAEKYLHRCVDSLLAQDLNPEEYEIILVDDGSTDESPRICDEYFEKYSQIKTIHKTNGGVSSARNVALDVTKGEYICFVDSDDWIKKASFVSIISICERENLDICFYKMDVEDNRGNFETQYNHRFRYGDVVCGKDVILGGFPIGSACVAFLSNKLVNSVKLRFDTSLNFSEDVYYMTQSLLLAARVSFVEMSPYVYAYNASSATNSPEKRLNKSLGCAEFARRLQYLSESEGVERDVRNYLKRWSNSIVFGELWSMIKQKNLLNSFIQSAEGLLLHPIKGRTLSWKTTMLIPIVNCKWFLRK